MASGNAATFRTLDRFDRMAETRNRLREMAEHVGEWAGIPLPIQGENLVIEPSYPFAQVLSSEPKPDSGGDFKLRSVFWSRRWRCEVAILETAWDGEGNPTKLEKVLIGGPGSVDQQLRTLGCSVAWGIEQEAKALATLAGLVRHHKFKTYLLTGAMLETSGRSGVTYMFRKLRPTVALRPGAANGGMRVLAALCMHPIGYYDQSWAGSMCPTDDVIAHLMLMRGDEPLFWRRCNQIPAFRPEAGA